MSTYDPRIVAQALEDLEDELARWSSLASDMLATATDTQRHALEAVERAMHNAAIVLDRARNDKESVERAIVTVNSTIEKCSVAIVTANGTLNSANAAYTQADATLQKWQMELEKAQAWLARAQARLDKAVRERESAQIAVVNAERDLSNAQYRLRNSQNDPDRRDTSSESAAVSRAQAELARAQQRLSMAQQEETEARAEVEKAKARVASCGQAVAISGEAVGLAQQGITAATQAVNSAERSMEFARAAERLVSIAQKNALAEVEAAEEMMTETKAAQEYTDNAATQLRNADAAENSAQLYSTSVRKELEYRVQQLVELNRPSLFESSGWGATNYGSSQSRAASTGSFNFDRARENTFESTHQVSMSLPSQDISLSEIEDVSVEDLSPSRLDTLEHGHDSFEQVLNSNSNPITLDKGSGKPYRIIDGRHRIFSARQKGMSSVPIIFV